MAWHLSTHDGWYAINQRNQTKHFYVYYLYFSCFQCMSSWNITYIQRGKGPRGVVATKLEFDIVVSEFDLLSRYYVLYLTNTLGKKCEFLYSASDGLNCSTNSFRQYLLWYLRTNVHVKTKKLNLFLFCIVLFLSFLISSFFLNSSFLRYTNVFFYCPLKHAIYI